MEIAYEIEALANYHCACGENPLWDDTRRLVYWTDIPNGRLFRYDVASRRHEPFYAGDPVGGFTLQRDGSLLLFQANRFSRLREDGAEETLVTDIDPEMERFNDVIADPAGRVYAGTFHSDPRKGGLYRVDVDGNVTCLFKGTGCSNGMGFSPDRSVFYWTCSTTRRIFRFTYDQGSGELSDREALVTLGEGEGTVDGMTVDATGDIWSAIWDGYGVRRYSPDGTLLGTIRMPVAKVSSVIFGGDALDEMYVTTAGGDPGAETADGTLYRIRAGVRGLPEFRSAVMLDSQ